MNRTAVTLDIAEQLLAFEYAASANSTTNTLPACRVFDFLRQSLTTLVGVQGFHGLLARALTIEKAKMPALSAVTVQPEGVLMGLSQLPPDLMDAASVALTAELLMLLVTFIGKDLVLSILLDIWPHLTVIGTGDSGEIENGSKK